MLPVELIANIIKFVKTRDLGKILTVNTIWRAEIIRELDIRHKYFMRQYSKACMDYEFDSQILENEANLLRHYSIRTTPRFEYLNKMMCKARRNKFSVFEQQVAVERCLLKNDLVIDDYDIFIMEQNIGYQGCGYDSHDYAYEPGYDPACDYEYE
jgi:hypothetical protein